MKTKRKRQRKNIQKEVEVKTPPPPTTTQNPSPFQDYQNLPKQNILEKLATMDAANLYLHLFLC